MFCPFAWGRAAETHSPGHCHETGISAAFRELTCALSCPFVSSFIPSNIPPNTHYGGEKTKAEHAIYDTKDDSNGGTRRG